MVGALADVATSDLVIVIVPTDDDVTSVVAGDGGLIEHGKPDMVILISSSVRPSTCRDLAAIAAQSRMHVLDAALTGGIRGAESGTINLLVGGDEAVAARIRPVLQAFTKNYHVLGDVGAGQVAKSASNLIHWAEIVAIEESFRMASRLGVSPAALRVALQEGGTDSRTMRELELMHFTWYKKDIDIAHDLAKDVELGLPVASLSRQLMDSITVESIKDLLA